MEGVESYEAQLHQVVQALRFAKEGSVEYHELHSLKTSIEELLLLTKDDEPVASGSSIDEEYALFKAEVADDANGKLELVEGMKCSVPYRHQSGSVIYHNAMVCEVLKHTNCVRVLFTNPTHNELLPCRFYMEGFCKFSEEKCQYSHGEVIDCCNVQEFQEPNLDALMPGATILAKQEDGLWYRAVVVRLGNDGKCVVRLDSSRNKCEVPMEDVFPFTNDTIYPNLSDDSYSSDDAEPSPDTSMENVINTTLMSNNLPDRVLGEWERYTTGFGSKMMEKMGYMVGAGLGKQSDGRLEPVPAFILPPGKSLDYCMQLKEKNMNKNLFNAERQLKRRQRRQEVRGVKTQQEKDKIKETPKTDIFDFLNSAVLQPNNPQTTYTNARCDKKNQLKAESTRNLNVAELINEKNQRGVQRDIDVIKTNLVRHCDPSSAQHKQLIQNLRMKEAELGSLLVESKSISNEQQRRIYTKQMTSF